MEQMSFLNSQEIELGNWLNDEDEVLFPEGLSKSLKEMYDAASGHEEKFVAIFKKLGKEAVADAMRISNEAKKRSL